MKNLTIEQRIARLEAENKAIISTLSHTERRNVKEWVDAELAKNQPATPVKDWVILSFKSTKTNNFYDLESDAIYIRRNGDIKWSLDDMLDFVKSGAWAVHSVKRLSDNLILTVGDNAFSPNGSKTKHTITKFEIRQKQVTRATYDGIDRIWVSWCSDEGGNWLDSIAKWVEPSFSFTTEDGKVITNPM